MIDRANQPSAIYPHQISLLIQVKVMGRKYGDHQQTVTITSNLDQLLPASYPIASPKKMETH